MNDSPGAAQMTGSRRVRDVAQRIAWELQEQVIPASDRSALRRIRPGEVGGPAFWKIAVRHLETSGMLVGSDETRRQRQERQWSTILAAMAAGPPSGRRTLGRALADVQVTEARVLRLLRAHEEALLDTVRAVVHQLSAAGCSFDWGDLAELVCSDGATYAEVVRRRVAYDYYRQERSRQTTKEDRE